MPKVSDVAKVPFSAAAAIKGFATGNYADAVANSVLLLGQVGWAGGKYYAPDKIKKEFGAEVYLLELGVQLCTALTLMHGSATDQGQHYELGSSKFELASENLKDATASQRSWSGESADAYNARNAQQLDWAAALADLDTKIAAILSAEAGEIKQSKLNLTYCRAAFTAAIPVAVALRMWNPAASWVFQITTFTTVMTAAIITTDMMRVEAEGNGLEIDVIAQQYRAIAQSAVVTGESYSAPTAAPAQKSTIGEFETISGPASLIGAESGEQAPAQAYAQGATTLDVTYESLGGAAAYTVPAAAPAPSQGSGAAASSGTGAPSGSIAPQPAGSVQRAPQRASGGAEVSGEGAEGAAAGGKDGERAPIEANEEVVETAAGVSVSAERRTTSWTD